jgi:hypothetical protein
MEWLKSVDSNPVSLLSFLEPMRDEDTCEKALKAIYEQLCLPPETMADIARRLVSMEGRNNDGENIGRFQLNNIT